MTTESEQLWRCFWSMAVPSPLAPGAAMAAKCWRTQGTNFDKCLLLLMTCRTSLRTKADFQGTQGSSLRRVCCLFKYGWLLKDVQPNLHAAYRSLQISSVSIWWLKVIGLASFTGSRGSIHVFLTVDCLLPEFWKGLDSSLDYLSSLAISAGVFGTKKG